MPDTRAEELGRFKRSINLTEYAAAQGFEIDRRESSRCSVVMRGPNGDKIVVTVNRASGQWVYFSVHDEGDSGTIIDFVQHRQPLDMGRVRMELRPWIGEGSAPPRRPPKARYAEKVEPSSKDMARVAAQYARMEPVTRHPYLEGDRAIPAEVLACPRFAGKIRRDGFGNAVFPHYNRDGLCGYEIKNRGFTGFAKGGIKGAWASVANSADKRLCITESGIDALSYHAIRQPIQTRYISIGGAMNPDQPALLKAALARLPEGGELVIATDNDDGGDLLLESIRAITGETDRADLAVIEDRPPRRGQDWNAHLKAAAPVP